MIFGVYYLDIKITGRHKQKEILIDTSNDRLIDRIKLQISMSKPYFDTENEKRRDTTNFRICHFSADLEIEGGNF